MSSPPTAITIGKIVPGPPAFRNSTIVMAANEPAAIVMPRTLRADVFNSETIPLAPHTDTNMNTIAGPEFKNHG